jgi:hypothetical protein
MKTLACLIIAAGALASPVLGFAQSTAPVTRAQVRAELIRLEKAGYDPSAGSTDANYPAAIQAAEAKIAAQDNQQATNNAVGGASMNGTSAAGSHLHPSKPAASCVGPASYCNPYFGS